ncbi:MAG: DNA recombination protein RmuC [Bacillota bacterium]
MDAFVAGLLVVVVVLLALVLIRQKGMVDHRQLDLAIMNNLNEFRKEIQTSVEASRTEMNAARENLNERAGETLKLMIDMQATVKEIISKQEEANRLGQSLKDILSTPKLRGNYGEMVLEELLERVLPKGMWDRQYRIKEGCVVDIVIKYRDMCVPVDSKFPRDNYIRYMECADPRDKEMFWKAYEKDVQVKIKEISRYIAPEYGTSDFALMFVPSEAIYYETIAEKNYLGQQSKIYEEAERHRVIPVSPNTFYAFLQVVLTGMRNLEVLNQAREIQAKLLRMQNKFELFYKQYEAMGKELEKAAEAYRKGDKHISLYKRELDETLRIEVGGGQGTLPG